MPTKPRNSCCSRCCCCRWTRLRNPAPVAAAAALAERPVSCQLPARLLLSANHGAVCNSTLPGSHTEMAWLKVACRVSACSTERSHLKRRCLLCCLQHCRVSRLLVQTACLLQQPHGLSVIACIWWRIHPDLLRACD